MSAEIEHRNAEHKAKCWLREQWTSHRTHVDEFTPFEGVDYDCQVARMAKGVMKYVVKEKGEQGARYYVSTTGLDWQ